jgi:hypothetical protein
MSAIPRVHWSVPQDFIERMKKIISAETAATKATIEPIFE